MYSIGPFSLQAALAAAVVLLAWGLARVLGQRWNPPVQDAPHRRPENILLDAVLLGLLAARIGYIVQWWPEYAAAPPSMLALGDGGFSFWAGLVSALGLVFWWSRRQPGLRLPMLAGLALASALWWLVGVWIERARLSAPPLPNLVLETPDGKARALHAELGRPVLLNLWATWCPPCRREMPVLAQAQRNWPEAAILLVNQGDGRELVERYLAHSGLQLRDVLLDPESRTAAAMASRVFPTTLFFDAEGRLRDVHVGPLSHATLAERMQRHFGLPSRPAEQPRLEPDTRQQTVMM